MSDFETRDANSPADETPATPKPEVWLPPRLREKLEAGSTTSSSELDDWKPKRGSPMPAILTTIAVLIVAVGAYTWWRNGARREGRAEAGGAAQTQHAATAPAAGPADSAVANDTLMSGTSPATPSTTPPATPSATASRSTGSSAATPSGGASASGSASSATASRPSATTPSRPSGGEAPATGGEAAKPSGSSSAPATSGFGLLVGSYLFEDRANSERDRLASVTGLPAIVHAAAEGGSTMYRVIVGKFSSRAAAERRASVMIDSSWVNQAQVVARPK